MTTDRPATSRHAVLMASLLSVSATALSASPLAAQDIEATQDTPNGDDIVVTGSRLKRDPNLGSASPVVTITAEALQGGADVTEGLREIPALASSVTSAQTIDPGELDSGASIGAATLNLRGLGAQRTLVLVNGRRHVAGVAESAIVDVNSIPPSLIESVEVLTGGASAVYGADAVTGVVNFVLQDDFDGVEVGARGGISDNGDGERFELFGKFGKNFGDDRGNFVIAADYSRDDGLRFGDREQYRDGNISADGPNPFLRFQQGDLGGTDTPNFNAFYRPENGRFPFGFRIPQPGSSDFDAIFSGGVAPTAAEQALIDRAVNAPTRFIGSQYQFQITSAGGVIIPADFLDPQTDINSNGISDCLESFTGFNGLFDFANAFGLAGGCYINTENGLEVVQDGLIASDFNAFGGNQVIFDNNAFLVPEIERFAINILTDYDISDNANVYFEGKYVRQETTFGTVQNSFYDLLFVAPDNPFIPTQLQGVADNAGGLYITRDPTDLGPNIDENLAETYRFVGGINGELSDTITFDASVNWGRYETVETNNNNVLLDRFFAAIDVTTDASGNPVCRSELDPTVRSPSTIFGIPTGQFGYLTFEPGQGQCAPANLFGVNSISAEAVDFITATTINRFETEQLVIQGLLTGDTRAFLNLPYDAIDFVVGLEYRDERSFSQFDPLVRGILPVTTVDGEAGQFVGDILDADGNRIFPQDSLATPPDVFQANSGGQFDVFEIFGEIGTTLVEDVPGINELRLEGAARYGDYSTVGGVLTWAVNGFYSPVEDVRFRGTFSRAVRAPNISELFAPPQGVGFRPFDPCDQTEIDRLQADGDPNIQNRIANCRADGIPVGFSDPLSARFTGTIAGNPDLQEETADTFTVGVVLQPRFVPGLNVTVDYYQIDISDAISLPDPQDVVDNCYDSATFPNDFCSSFTRNRDPASAQFLGFNSFTQQQINFVAIETAGIDAAISYGFAIGEHDIGLSAIGSWVDKVDFFFDPTDDTNVDPELGEIGRPEWSGRASVNWAFRSFSLGYTLQYLSEMTLGDVEIETVDAQFGEVGFADEYFIHDLIASYSFSDDRFEVFGGVNNFTDEKPFITERAYPVNPIGRSFFLGVRALF
ncbi:TonB-dependent receptor domain-containing protein [Erythrobacter sp.]|jgi:outer membrane receptor protein involved in Fe transport|uniref:TonB-dependent receptor domain-containing protein n=1 Tax=Erythrobacter sp. TaxID=1042 RepID=UPI002EBF24E0|nr:TonB-dependent receptor [Erythrobacter sp.]